MIFGIFDQFAYLAAQWGRLLSTVEAGSMCHNTLRVDEGLITVAWLFQNKLLGRLHGHFQSCQAMMAVGVHQPVYVSTTSLSYHTITVIISSTRVWIKCLNETRVTICSIGGWIKCLSQTGVTICFEGDCIKLLSQTRLDPYMTLYKNSYFKRAILNNQLPFGNTWSII